MVDRFEELDELTDEAVLTRVADLLAELERLNEAGCVACTRRLCGHEVLFSVALGLKDAPRCLPCLARGMDRPTAELRDQLSEHMQHRDCYRQAWEAACRQEGFAPTPHPGCLWSGIEVAVPVPPPLTEEHSAVPSATPFVWDAGAMSCGDLVLALRMRLQKLPPAALLRVTARDPAAPEDLPAWCRLTGNRLVQSAHPHYLIQRKER